MSTSATELKDAKAAARKAGLRYVNDAMPGIHRKKTDAGFYYLDSKGKEVTDEDTLARIRSLVLPPAWEDVWISPYPNGHLQATGIDKKGRKQYKYHPDWCLRRNLTKFDKTPEFAKALEKIRQKIDKDMRKKAISKEKVLATVVKVMEKAYIRIGNTNHTRKNGSFGLTTLLDDHVDIKAGKVNFRFRGKKGVEHDITLTDRKLATIIKKCRDIPGQELFQYFDQQGERHTVDSGDINEYLQEIAGDEISSKDFRTWAGSLHAFRLLWQLPAPNSQREAKRMTVDVIKQVSMKLGNTVAVCRKYYVHPTLLDAYEKGNLAKFYEQCRKSAGGGDSLEFEEKMLIHFLRSSA